jgi:hypothetical protein
VRTASRLALAVRSRTMGSRRFLGASLAVLCLLAPARAAAAERAIAPLAVPTAVRVWHGVAVLSVRGPGGYLLATQSGSQPPQPVPGIASSREAFDANIGPGPHGESIIVFSRCGAHGRCRLMRTTRAGGAELPIRGSAGVDGYEHAAAVWGNRLAFVRKYKRGSERVYVRPLEAGKSVRSVRVPGVPARTCEVECEAITDGVVGELALRGRRLVENVRFFPRAAGICGEYQVRLLAIGNRASTLVSSSLCGLSGSTILGVSLSATYISFARICPGDPGGCRDHHTLVYRYRLADRRLELAPVDAFLLFGFASEDGANPLAVTWPLSAEGYASEDVCAIPSEPAATCYLERLSSLHFTPYHHRGS